MAQVNTEIGVKISVDSGNAIKSVGEIKNQLSDATKKLNDFKIKFGETSTEFKNQQQLVESLSQTLIKTQEPIGSLKNQLKEATANLIEMRDKFGETSVEAINSAKKVGDLKDRIGDAKTMADSFNPDAKFKAFSGAIQSVVGGFSALQGAQALFGAESEDLTKTLAKVQGALALSQGVNSILEAKDSFKNLKSVVSDFTIVQKVLNYVLEGEFATNEQLQISKEKLIATIESSIAVSESENAVKQSSNAISESNIAIKESDIAISQSQNAVTESSIALKESENAVTESSIAVTESSIALKETDTAISEAQLGIKEASIIATEGQTIATQVSTATIETNIALKEADVISTEAQTIAQVTLATATTGTSVAMQVLRAVLISTGIGAIVVAVGFLVSKIIDWTSSTEDNKKAQEGLNDELDRQKELLNSELSSIEYVTKARTLRAKIAGKTEEEISAIEKQGGIDRLDALKENVKRTEEISAKALKTKGTTLEEQKKFNQQVLDADKKLQDERDKQTFENLDRELKVADKSREDAKKVNDKKLEDAKKYNDDRIQLDKEYNDKLVALQTENYLNSIKDEAEKSKQRIIIDFENKRKEINASKYSEEQKRILIAEEQKKSEAELLKLNEDKNKKLLEENRKALIEIQKLSDDYLQKRLDAEKEYLNKATGITKSNFIELEKLEEDLQKEKAKRLYELKKLEIETSNNQELDKIDALKKLNENYQNELTKIDLDGINKRNQLIDTDATINKIIDLADKQIAIEKDKIKQLNEIEKQKIITSDIPDEDKNKKLIELAKQLSDDLLAIDKKGIEERLKLKGGLGNIEEILKQSDEQIAIEKDRVKKLNEIRKNEINQSDLPIAEKNKKLLELETNLTNDLIAIDKKGAEDRLRIQQQFDNTNDLIKKSDEEIAIEKDKIKQLNEIQKQKIVSSDLPTDEKNKKLIELAKQLADDLLSIDKKGIEERLKLQGGVSNVQALIKESELQISVEKERITKLNALRKTEIEQSNLPTEEKSKQLEQIAIKLQNDLLTIEKNGNDNIIALRQKNIEDEKNNLIELSKLETKLAKDKLDTELNNQKEIILNSGKGQDEITKDLLSIQEKYQIDLNQITNDGENKRLTIIEDSANKQKQLLIDSLSNGQKLEKDNLKTILDLKKKDINNLEISETEKLDKIYKLNEQFQNDLLLIDKKANDERIVIENERLLSKKNSLVEQAKIESEGLKDRLAKQLEASKKEISTSPKLTDSEKNKKLLDIQNQYAEDIITIEKNTKNEILKIQDDSAKTEIDNLISKSIQKVDEIKKSAQKEYDIEKSKIEKSSRTDAEKYKDLQLLKSNFEVKINTIEQNGIDYRNKIQTDYVATQKEKLYELEKAQNEIEKDRLKTAFENSKLLLETSISDADLRQQKIKELEINLNNELNAIDTKSAEEKKALIDSNYLNETEALLQLQKLNEEFLTNKAKSEYDNAVSEINNSTKTDEEKANALLVLNTNLQNQLTQIDATGQAERNKIIDDQLTKELNAYDVIIADAKNTFNARQEAIVNEQLLLDDSFNKKLISEADYNAKTKALSDERTSIAEEEGKQRIDIANAIASSLGQLSDLVGKQTAVGKGLAVAQATINTFLGATEVIKQPSVLPEPIATITKVINVATIVASGIKSVKEILKVKVPNGGGGGGGSAPNPESIAPPLTPQATTTMINQSQINDLSSATTRAFVLESDVSGNQERIQRLNRASRIN